MTTEKIPRLSRSNHINVKPIASDWEWQYEGACRDKDPELFFLEYALRGPAKRKKEIAAIAVCNTCPVLQQCRDHALKVPEMFGVWGGLTEEQRRILVRRNGGTWL